MNSAVFSPPESIITSSRRGSQIRATVTRRIAGSLWTWISPFERWSDENYAPLHLEYVAHATDDAFEVTAELHGFDPSQVFVELHRGQVILLLSRSAMDGAEGLEYYNEVPIPADVRANEAYVQITPNLLIVRLRKYPALVRGFITPLRRLFRLTPS